MARPLIFAALLSLLFHMSCLGRPQKHGWQAWLLGDPDLPPPDKEEGKKMRILRHLFITPELTGTTHRPDCAEDYMPHSEDQCVKLVQLNQTAQLEFLLQRLNAMYAVPVTRRGNEDLSTSDFSSTGPLGTTISTVIPPEPEEEDLITRRGSEEISIFNSSSTGPLGTTISTVIPPEPEDETKESVEVAIVIADVFKGDKPRNNNLNVGRNVSSVEEIESASDLEMESNNSHLEKTNLRPPAHNAGKCDPTSSSENSVLKQLSDIGLLLWCVCVLYVSDCLDRYFN
jgi:hypothetical protein